MHEKFPEKLEHKRTNILPSGWNIKEENEGTVRISYIAQLGGASLNIIKDQIAGRSAIYFDTMKLLYQFISMK